MNANTLIERTIYFSKAKRATTGIITQIVDDELVDFHVGKLHGKIVSNEQNEYRFNTKEEAIKCAREFRKRCIDKLQNHSPL